MTKLVVDSLLCREPGGGRGDRDWQTRALAGKSEHDQGLLAGPELPPAQPDRFPVPVDDPRHIVQGLAGQRQSNTVEKQLKP
jgi:hypothetical protein